MTGSNSPPGIASQTLEDLVREVIVTRLNLLHLLVDPAELRDDTPLFAPATAGGLEVDSLSSLEILSGLADKFQMPLDDIEPGDFYSIATLSSYLRRHDASGKTQRDGD